MILTAYNQCGFEQHAETFTLTLVGIFESPTQDVFGFKVYPNPAATQVKIDFSVSKRSPVKLRLFDAMGNLIKTFSDDMLNAGSHHYIINFSLLNLTKGVYHIRLISAETNATTRIVFM